MHSRQWFNTLVQRSPTVRIVSIDLYCRSVGHAWVH